MTDEQPAIVCRGVTKRYATTTALDALDLEIRRGEVFGYLGSNGAGKTTTIRCLLDLIRPDAGTITVLGLDGRRDSVAIRRRCGYLPGDLRLYPRLTARTLLTYLAHLQGRGAPRIDELAERLQLPLAQRCGEMSHGQRQKVGIVQAFMHTPDVLILDEPTTALDPLMQDAVHDLLREHRARGGTVFLSSHDLAEVARVCDRVGILRSGVLVAVQDVAALRGTASVVTIDFAAPVDPARFNALPGVDGVTASGSSLTLRVHGDIDAVVKAAAQHTVRSIRSSDMDLDETLREYYAQAPHAR